MKIISMKKLLALAVLVTLPIGALAQNFEIQVQGNAIDNGDGTYGYNYWLYNGNLFESRTVSMFDLAEVYNISDLTAPPDWVGSYDAANHIVDFVYTLPGGYSMAPGDYRFGFYYLSPNAPQLVDYDINTAEGFWEGTVVGAGNTTELNLDDFSVVLVNGLNKVQWSTIQEYGVVGYNVYRDGQLLNDQIIPAVNNDGSSYFYMDQNVHNAAYTLTQVLGNGQESELASVEFSSSVPTTPELSQNFPNPFNPETSIYFELPESGMVDLSVYSVSGELVATLAHSEMAAGSHNVVFDGSNLSSGIYFYSLTAGNQTITRKMTLIK